MKISVRRFVGILLIAVGFVSLLFTKTLGTLMIFAGILICIRDANNNKEGGK